MITGASLNKRTGRRERGVVLIMALLIVVLVTTVVVSVSWRFGLAMARNENRWHGSQARAYMEGAEQLARKALFDDLMETGPVDHLNELWAQMAEPLPTDEGWIRGTIEDAHGRINLNNLIRPAPTPPKQGQRGGTQDPWDMLSSTQRLFVRLLQTIELEEGPITYQAAMELVDAIQDWLDPDDQISGYGGAEGDFYRDMDPPYPITNGPMTNVSELSLIKGMTPELYEKLLPLVIVLPYGEKMNVNTLKPEILRAFNRRSLTLPLTAEEGNRLDNERRSAQEGFRSVDEFFSGPEANVLIGQEAEKDILDVTSRYFLFNAETLVGEQVRRSKTLLFRGQLDGKNHVHVIRRSDANF
jgi:general secretion pathway protein K